MECPNTDSEKEGRYNAFRLRFSWTERYYKEGHVPLPHIGDVIDKMEGAKYWSKLDAASAYWSMPLADDAKEKTAFSVPNGKYEFNVTAFGLCNAGASYQRMMDVCLARLPSNRILAYMDDVIIFSKTWSEHKKALDELFGRFESMGVTVKASKCEFAMQEIEFLGFHLSEEGIKLQRRLTSAIYMFYRPANKKDIKRVLGLAGFYRHFIRDF